MAIRVRKRVRRLGDSIAVIIPKIWVHHYEQEHKQPLEEIEIELGEDLIIRPLPSNSN